jgi:hypothetical protein
MGKEHKSVFGIKFSNESIKVGIMLAIFIYGMTKDVKLMAQIMAAYIVLFAVFN